jgi:hypothetical protein
MKKNNKIVKVLFIKQPHGFKECQPVYPNPTRRALVDLVLGHYVGDTIILNFPELYVSINIQWSIMKLIYEHPDIKKAYVKTESVMVFSGAKDGDLYSLDVSNDITDDLADLFVKTKVKDCLDQLYTNPHLYHGTDIRLSSM